MSYKDIKSARDKDENSFETDDKNLMIACYREQYSEESLDYIRGKIQDASPEKIIILKLLEEKRSSELIDANIGFRDKKKLADILRKEQKEKIDRLAKGLIKMVERFDIPYEVHIGINYDLASEIIDEFSKRSVDHVIIHTPTRSSIGRMMEGSVSRKVLKTLGEDKVTLLE